MLGKFFIILVQSKGHIEKKNHLLDFFLHDILFKSLILNTYEKISFLQTIQNKIPNSLFSSEIVKINQLCHS